MRLLRTLLPLMAWMSTTINGQECPYDFCAPAGITCNWGCVYAFEAAFGLVELSEATEIAKNVNQNTDMSLFQRAMRVQEKIQKQHGSIENMNEKYDTMMLQQQETSNEQQHLQSLINRMHNLEHALQQHKQHQITLGDETEGPDGEPGPVLYGWHPMNTNPDTTQTQTGTNTVQPDSPIVNTDATQDDTTTTDDDDEFVPDEVPHWAWHPLNPNNLLQMNDDDDDDIDITNLLQRLEHVEMKTQALKQQQQSQTATSTDAIDPHLSYGGVVNSDGSYFHYVAGEGEQEQEDEQEQEPTLLQTSSESQAQTQTTKLHHTRSGLRRLRARIQQQA